MIINVAYNIGHNVYYKKESDDFNLYQKFNIIGYTDNAIVYIIIKPQFNLLNFNEII